MALLVGEAGTATASTATVPDDFPTVQAAIDAGVDTVSLRSGDYAEVVQAYRGVVLLGVGSQRPRLKGLAITNPYARLSLAWNVSGIDFADSVTISTNNQYARFINVSFTDCALDAGLQHVLSDDIYDINLLSFTRCRLPATCQARMESMSMQSDTIDAGVKWTVNGYLRARDCWFRGGTGPALDIDGSVIGGEITSCLFEGYGVAIQASTLDSFDSVGFAISSNIIRRMSTGAVYADCYSATLRDNVVEDCAEGVYIALGTRLQLLGNHLLRCGRYGVWLTSADVLLADGNVVGYCEGDGIALEFPNYSDLTLTHNTLVKNAGSGINLRGNAVMNNVVAQGNVACWNGKLGLAIPGPQASVVLGCNDWYANSAGAVSGVAPGASDLAVDPLFCDLANNDVHLRSDSPLLDAPGCGLIGALGKGCNPAPTPLAIHKVSPNPAMMGGFAVEFVLLDASPAQLELLDVAGRLLSTRQVASPTPGSHVLEFSDARALPPGIYFLRLRQNASEALTRVAVTR